MPGGKDVISIKWIYNTKQDVAEEVWNHKERLVQGALHKSL